MTDATFTSPSRQFNGRYDAPTIAFHWLTVILVLALFGTAMTWTYTPREWGLRWLQGIHISLGIGLAVAIVGRIVWRATAGWRLPEVGSAPIRLLAKLVHVVLYALLIVQIVLGFAIQSVSGDPLSFFGLVIFPSVFAENRDFSHRLESLHNIGAWSLMAVAFGHAAAALVHQYGVKDRVLERMWPGKE